MFMPKLRINLTLVALVCVALLACACSYDSAARADRTRRAAVPPLPPAAPLDSDDKASEVAIRSLEERVRRDPEDHAAHNRLAGFYLQRVRETGNAEYINLAARAARASLASVSEVRNAGGLAALAEAELASHDFVAARDHAMQLIELDPGKSYPFGILCDAQLELGDYREAARAIQRMERAGGSINSGSEIRMARLSTLHGDMPGAQRHLSNALALNLPAPPRETVAWCRWQLGETSSAVGDYETAERHYRDALTTFPDYYRALASLGRVRAALLPSSIWNCLKCCFGAIVRQRLVSTSMSTTRLTSRSRCSSGFRRAPGWSIFKPSSNVLMRRSAMCCFAPRSI